MQESYSNKFLVAMPGLEGEPFEKSVIYLCQHDENGAMGIVLTYPLHNNAEELYRQMNIELNQPLSVPVHLGGPVQTDHGFILHQPTEQQWQSSVRLSSEVCLTTSTDILNAISEGQAPYNPIIALGYAGWDEGQLEQELKNNDWVVAGFDPHIMFETPTTRKWEQTLNSLGISPAQLSGFSGHA